MTRGERCGRRRPRRERQRAAPRATAGRSPASPPLVDNAERAPTSSWCSRAWPTATPAAFLVERDAHRLAVGAAPETLGAPRPRRLRSRARRRRWCDDSARLGDRAPRARAARARCRLGSRGRRRRPGAGRLRGGAALLAAALRVRPADLPAPGDPAQARRHGDAPSRRRACSPPARAERLDADPDDDARRRWPRSTRPRRRRW